MADVVARGTPGPILIVIPVLARPQNVRPLLESIAAGTPEPHRVLFVVDDHDAPERAAITRYGGEQLVTTGLGYAGKVNAAAAVSSEPYLFLGADDLRFHEGWATRALERMSDTVAVVGTNDLGNRRVVRGRHATHSLIARWYVDAHGTIDRPGAVLHDGYSHNFVDDELVETAKARGAWAHAGDAVVEHLHPNWGKAVDDATYRRGMANFRADRTLFRERSRLWTRSRSR